jgi:lysophospholipase
MKHIAFLLLFSFGVGISVSVESKEYSYVSQELTKRESVFPRFVSETLLPFWNTNVVKGHFVNTQQLNIHYAYSLVPNAKKAIVLSPGRVEGYEKYHELVYDFTQQGYSVFIIDHQGQGLSSRRLENKYKGYVENFNDYVVDLHQFIEEVVKPKYNKELILVSHSMGGAIGLRYVQQHPEQFSKAVFSSPMWGLKSGSIPKPLAKGILNFVNWTTSIVTDQNPYFFGGKDYNPVKFEENQLTTSEQRYQYFRSIYAEKPELQLGSVTFNWIKESVSAIDTAFEELNLVKLPIMVFQAQNDEVVDNVAQDSFCNELARLGNPCINDMPIVIENAKHELFIELDKPRVDVLDKIFIFLKDND